MITALFKKIFGTRNQRALSKIQPTVDAINEVEPKYEAMTDEELQGQTSALKKRLENGETLDDILVDAFATVRETARRQIGERPYDVQLIGGIVLHQGKVAEMKTGEGKTLASTMPAYLNALTGKGSHIVTVNEYLAERDAEWMGQIYKALGMTVGVIQHGQSNEERRLAYQADITYGTNNEFGFDYLRDNMKYDLEEMVQRPFNFAIIDEVDSILIDEARTPLIISGQAEGSSEMYTKIDRIIPALDADDYDLDEKMKTVALNDSGIEKVEDLLRDHGLLTEGGIYDVQNISLVHHVNQALKAHTLFTRDDDYIVRDNDVVIIDEFTGRMMPGRRYSEGLHQAIEAKENVEIQRENQTLASITFQNYFRQYPKLSGMTGTAMTEAEEFGEIYDLDCIAIPTNKPVIREDNNDEIYRTKNEKYQAIVELIDECVDRGQPVLVGTTTIDKSEELSHLLKKNKIKHHVLNARYHEREASIVAQAGQPGSVTIATNMAGRGTDIKLGGNAEMKIEEVVNDDMDDAVKSRKISEIRAKVEEDKETVLNAGGLFVIATERHESRRIDNQLRGRAGRQGDPGASQFFLSLEDDLMRIFGSERMDGMLQRLGLEEGEAITHSWINKAIERAQKKVEAQNFDIRKNLLKYDDVVNDQRKVVYDQRKQIMASDDLSDMVRDMRHDVVEDLVMDAIPANSYPEQWETDGIKTEAQRLLNLNIPMDDWATEEGIDRDTVENRIREKSDEHMAKKVSEYGADVMRQIEKMVVLQILDSQWKDHLLNLDHLRQGISLRAYGQKDPLNEYKAEAFAMFEDMLAQFRQTVTQTLSQVQIQARADIPDLAPAGMDNQNVTETRKDPAMKDTAGRGADPQTGATVQTIVKPEVDENDPTTWEQTPRNAPCPCGSGKKYKHCHGSVG